VFAVAGGLVSLVTGFLAVAADSQMDIVPDAGTWVVGAAVLFFVAATILALIVNMPFNVGRVAMPMRHRAPPPHRHGRSVPGLRHCPAPARGSSDPAPNVRTCMSTIHRTARFVAALSVVLFAFAVLPLSDIVSFSSRSSWILLSLLLLLASAVVICAYSERAVEKGLRLPGMPPAAAGPVRLPRKSNDREFAQFAMEVFRERFGADAVAPLIGAVLDPGGYVTRISEEIALDEESYRQVLTRTVRSSQAQTVLLPVVRPCKGVLVDEFAVKVGGTAAATLSYVEGQGAMLTVLETLFEAVFPAERQIQDHELLLKEVLDAAVGEKPLDEAAVGDLEDRLSRAAQAQPVPAARTGSDDEEVTPADYRAPLVQLAGYLAASYFILVPVALEANQRVKVETTRTLRRRNRLAQTGDKVRVALGLNIRTHLIPLPQAPESLSYHMRTRAPEGMYTYSAALRVMKVPDADLALPTIVETARPRVPDLRMNEPEGLEFVHVYARDLDNFAAGGGPNSGEEHALALRLEFREKPPGLLAVVFLLSGYLLALAWAVGRYHHLVFPQQASGTTAPAASTWPTILFGIPALVSGWLVSRFTSDALRRVSLTTVLVTMWLVLNTAAAVLLAALKTSGPSPETFNVGKTVVHHATWAALMVSTGAHFALTALMALSRADRYVRRAARATADSTEGAS
jgi:hypothetical protein